MNDSNVSNPFLDELDAEQDNTTTFLPDNPEATQIDVQPIENTEDSNPFLAELDTEPEVDVANPFMEELDKEDIPSTMDSFKQFMEEKIVDPLRALGEEAEAEGLPTAVGKGVANVGFMAGKALATLPTDLTYIGMYLGNEVGKSYDDVK